MKALRFWLWIVGPVLIGSVLFVSAAEFGWFDRHDATKYHRDRAARLAESVEVATYTVHACAQAKDTADLYELLVSQTGEGADWSKAFSSRQWSVGERVLVATFRYRQYAQMDCHLLWVTGAEPEGRKN